MSEGKIILQDCVECDAKCKPICFAYCDDCHVKMEEELLEAERRGEERGWKAARRATNGCVISMDYSEGGGPRFVAISDWRASEEYKEEE